MIAMEEVRVTFRALPWDVLTSMFCVSATAEKVSGGAGVVRFGEGLKRGVDGSVGDS